MRVFVAGSTGVLGKRLVERLADRGHEVVGLTRDDEGDELVESRGGEPRRGDVLNEESLRNAVGDESFDAVVHAATAIPTGDKVTREDWETNDRVRREGTENLVELADRVDADLYVQQSITWLAKNDDGSVFDEDSEPNPDPVTESALSAERIAREAEDESGFDVAVVRCGWYYSYDSAQTRMMAKKLLDGDLPVVGGGLLGRQDAETSLLHVDDSARAFAEVIESRESGTWHVADDEPVTYAEFLGVLTDRLDAPSPGRVPGWLAKFFVGPVTVDFFTSSAPTTNNKFRRDFDWSPKLPAYREGLDRVVENWVDEGVLVEEDDGYVWNGEE